MIYDIGRLAINGNVSAVVNGLQSSDKKKSIFLREMQFYIYLVKYDSKIIVEVYHQKKQHLMS